MPKPNFFIVGAPKCGTTALSEYLRGHPNVFMCHPKEPFYFATDFPEYASAYVKTEKQYVELFSKANENQYMIGEASAIYLYSEKAIQNIREFAPEAKIIVMLRNPVELVSSMHSQLLYSRDEDVIEIQKAWELSSERKQGLKIPKLCRDRKSLYYDEIAKLGSQLERLMEIFPKEQIEIIFSEDFFKNTKAVYQEVLSYLGLPDDERTDFPKVNQNKHHKLGWLANVTQHPPKELTNMIMKLKKKIGLEHIGVLRILRKINKSEIQRQPLSDKFKMKLIQTYYNEVVKLSRLTGRDLNHWVDYKCESH